MKDVYRKTISRTITLAAFVAAIFMFATPTQAQNCQFHIDLYDSYGDGWNGCTITVKVNSTTVLNNVTLSGGYGPGRFSFLADVNDVITTTFTPVSWQGECSYRLLDGNNSIILTSGPAPAGPPNISYTVTAASCVAPPVISGCTYTIRMWDDFGDGWNGGYLQVYIDNVLEHNNITMSGSGPVDFTFQVENGEEIKLNWVSGGWPYECEYRVYDPDMTEIFNDGIGGVDPTAKNKVIGYGACTFDLAVDAALLGYAENYWARREAPDFNIVHASLIDIEGSKPGYAKAVYKIGSVPADSTDGVAEAFNLTWNVDQADISFVQGITGLTPGPTPPVFVRVFVKKDLDGANDVALTPPAQAFDYKVKGFEDFDYFDMPFVGFTETNNLGWTTMDLDGGEVWEVVGAPGSGFLFHNLPSSDDWIFTPAANLEALASYRFQGYLVDAANATFDIAYGQAPNPASMTVFATASNVNGPGNISDFLGGLDPWFNTPAFAGPYYIGIHLRDGGVIFDWLKFDENPSPPPTIGYAFPGTAIGDFEDQLGAAINIAAVYKQPGKINKTYQVANTTDLYGINGDFLWDVETATPWITLTKETPAPTLQGYNFVPERPRQFQTFTMTINPAGLAPGLHVGLLRFYGTLFNDDFPPPNNGLVATNEIYEVAVNLRVVTTGTKNGPASMEATFGPLTVPGSPYDFIDPITQALIATVEVTNGVIDQLTVRTFPNQLPNNISRMMYVNRYFQLEHTASGPWTANVDFFYADQEASMVFDRMQLRGVRQPVPNGTWEDPIMGTTSVSDPGNDLVRVNDLNEINSVGNIALAHPWTIVVKNGDGSIPQNFALVQNYPNPFNPNTTISYHVAEERHVRIAVYNSLGEEIAVLVNETMAAGRYVTNFDASGLTSGTYIYRMTSGDFVQTRRMTLSK